MKLNRLIAITRKEIVQIWRDPRSLLIVFLMPAMLMALMGYGISLDQKNVPTCVFDREGSQQSQDLLKQFQASPYFRIAMVSGDYASLVQAINDGKCSLGLVIPNDFAEQLHKGGTVDVQGIVDATDDNTANLIFGYAEAVIAGYSADVQLEYFQSRGHTTVNPPVSVQARTWFNEDLDSSNFIVPGVVVIVMAVIGTFLTSLTVAREWERGTMEQLISTPVTPLEVTVGKLIPYFVLGLVDTAFCEAIAVLWFQVPFRGGIAMMVVASALFLAVVLLLGYWISAATKSQLAASQFSLVLTFLPAFLLSGFAFPIDQMPVAVQAITYLTPARYYLSLVKIIFLKGPGLGPLIPQLFALALFATIIGRMALRSFRKTL
ncbi:MAG TPA: ABC transporter permease [Candidatus Binataceae bacterium]|nr:ABC transporter permease [Candidatus Binataceae bacterium]